MKTIRILVGICMIWLLAACQATTTSSPPTTAALRSEFILAPDQSAAVTGTDLTLTFHSVLSDERCPSEMECVASGPVTVSLSVQRGNDLPTDFTLQTFTDQTGRSPDVQFEGVTNRAEVGGYLIQITSVTPYPRNASERIEPSEYRVGLLISNQ
ncbi:MAG TPA: hypothetical protein VGK56_16705 [Anaerolineales bacterium]